MNATTTVSGRPFERKLPPVVAVGMAALTLAITSGILVVAQIGGASRLLVPSLFAAGGIVLELVAVGMLGTVRPFAWPRFVQVARWALLAYVAQSAIIEWSFVKNHVPGRPLSVLTAGLVVFATAVPIMIAFTVARYQEVGVPTVAS